MTEGEWNTDGLGLALDPEDTIHYFDNIDKARGWVDNHLAGQNATANHPGNYIDTFIYDKEYMGVGQCMELKHFKYIKMELI